MIKLTSVSDTPRLLFESILEFAVHAIPPTGRELRFIFSHKPLFRYGLSVFIDRDGGSRGMSDGKKSSVRGEGTAVRCTGRECSRVRQLREGVATPLVDRDERSQGMSAGKESSVRGEGTAVPCTGRECSRVGELDSGFNPAQAQPLINRLQ